MQKWLLSTACAAAFFFAACRPRLEALKLSKGRASPTGFRTDGFYFNRPGHLCFFFYENGVLRDGLFYPKGIESILAFNSDPIHLKNSQKLPYSWGIFEVHGQQIAFEKWISGDGNQYPKIKFFGTVANDTTLLIDHPTTGLDTFYFLKMVNKPDSICPFF